MYCSCSPPEQAPGEGRISWRHSWHSWSELRVQVSPADPDDVPDTCDECHVSPWHRARVLNSDTCAGPPDTWLSEPPPSAVCSRRSSCGHPASSCWPSSWCSHRRGSPWSASANDKHQTMASMGMFSFIQHSEICVQTVWRRATNFDHLLALAPITIIYSEW